MGFKKIIFDNHLLGKGFMELKIMQKIADWQERLLDLTNRNRLINCPEPKTDGRVQRHSLLIKYPESSVLWTKLSDSDETISFPIPPDLYKNEQEKPQTELFYEKEQTTNNICFKIKKIYNMREVKQFYLFTRQKL